MAGRPALPTALKARGTLSPSKVNPLEPKLEPHYPDPPAHLDEEERAAWLRFGADLEPMGVVTRADWAVLELLVTTYVQGQRLRASIRAAGGGPVYQSGVLLRARPEFAMLNEVDRKTVLLLSRFGLTPADRSRVSSPEASASPSENPEDEFAAK